MSKIAFDASYAFISSLTWERRLTVEEGSRLDKIIQGAIDQATAELKAELKARDDIITEISVLLEKTRPDL